ncbi:uncharacterized protein LOC120837093, partial [Ixodes scapularis]|uniref:uncharacterized protein LOC120837093 n=1 Tax=Ixodes scapularis TaxID=6945 RepID=UPI001A9E75C4
MASQCNALLFAEDDGVYHRHKSLAVTLKRLFSLVVDLAQDVLPASRCSLKKVVYGHLIVQAVLTCLVDTEHFDGLLPDGVSLENLLHQLRIRGGNVLVVVPGRAPICLRCHRAGHIRRDCRVPRCNLCQTFGHEASSCVKTYARVTGNNTAVVSDDAECMDVFEAQRAATATTPTDQQTQGGPAENDGVCDEAKPRPSPGASNEKAAPEVVEKVAAEKVTDTPDLPAATAVPGDDDGKDHVDEDVGTTVHDEVKVQGDDDGKPKEGEGGVDGRLKDAETGAARRRHEGVSSKIADRELRRLER